MIFTFHRTFRIQKLFFRNDIELHEKPDALDLKKEESDDSKKISQDLLENSKKLDSKISDPNEIAKFPKGDETISQFRNEKKKFEEIMKDPSLYNDKGVITKEGVKKIEAQYNELIKAYNTVQGVIEGSAGKSAQKGLEDMEKAQGESSKKLQDFSDTMKEIRDSRQEEQREKARMDAKRAQEISKGSQSVANNNPEAVREGPDNWPPDAC